jgi:hypothetical protein
VLQIEAPFSPPAADRESSKCKEVIPFYCSSLANPVRLRRTTGKALTVAFSILFILIYIRLEFQFLSEVGSQCAIFISKLEIMKVPSAKFLVPAFQCCPLSAASLA